MWFYVISWMINLCTTFGDVILWMTFWVSISKVVDELRTLFRGTLVFCGTKKTGRPQNWPLTHLGKLHKQNWDQHYMRCCEFDKLGGVGGWYLRKGDLEPHFLGWEWKSDFLTKKHVFDLILSKNRYFWLKKGWFWGVPGG